ncbi:MAG: sugar phosphate isomerase/epimerase, partial [Lachnospiraceae bacterium]|nr:sugar phosphate isomerase/epimerase [Lachnospiraceae bacterium]
MKTYVQQIMLGTACKNEAAALDTLKRIKAAGYDGLELNQFMVHPSSLMVRMLTKAAGMPTGNGGKYDWHRLLSEADLTVSSFHTDLGSLERDAAVVAAEAKSYGTDTVVITGMYRFDYSDEKAVRDLAARLNKAGEALRAEGCALLYHNHNVELQRVRENVRAYDILIEET